MKRLVKFEKDLIMKVERFVKFTCIKIRLALLTKMAARKLSKIRL